MTLNNLEGFLLEKGTENQIDPKPLLYGTFAMYINQGSQYAVWHQFPRAIRYVVTDLDTGMLYHSMDMELSISWADNSIYEKYSQYPHDQIVTEKYILNPEELYFTNVPKSPIRNFEIYGTYMGQTSNTLQFWGTVLKLKGF